MVSVIIPTYKPENYVYKCLSALGNQTLRSDKFEIIVILNGDKEPYYTNLLDFIARQLADNAVRLIYTEVKGVSNARNVGIESSTGDYITFIDDDDVVSPNYLEELCKVSTPDCVGCSNSMSFTEDTEHLKSNFISLHYSNCLDKPYTQYRYRGFLSPPVMKLMHKSIIGDTRFDTKLTHSEDSVFCFELAAKIKRMQLADSSCIYYIYERQGSATRKTFDAKYAFRQLLIIEYKYFSKFFRHPLSYSPLYFGSRIYAAMRNFARHLF